jgi:chromosome segregation ATPase
METTDITIKILQNLQGDVAELKSDVTGLKSDVTGLKSDVTGLKSDVTGLKSDVTGLKSDVTGLRSDVERIDRTMKSLVTRDEFLTSMTLLDERMDRLHTRLVESDVRATTAHHETQRSLARLMDFIDAQSGLEGRIERCELDISDIKQRVF